MFFSQFVTHFNANRHRMPKAVADHIRRSALARVQERQQAGRGDTSLTFDDLIEQIERAIGA